MRQDYLKNIGRGAFKFVLFGGLLAGSVQLASAQSGVAGNGSTINIEQVGPENLAIVSSEGRNTANINQDGSGNTATIISDGRGNGESSGIVVQDGDNNTVMGTAEGDDNQFSVAQKSSGASNETNFTQLGSQNNVDVVQDATGLPDGLANSADITQTGIGNFAALNQTALIGQAGLYSNLASITQEGNDNLATSTQYGDNNYSEQVQVGDNNVSDILQTGDDNSIIHRQYGSNLAVPDYLGGTRIEQNGGASIVIEQYDAYNMPFGPPPG